MTLIVSIIKETWFKDTDKNIIFFSDKADPNIPTLNAGVNTKYGKNYEKINYLNNSCSYKIKDIVQKHFSFFSTLQRMWIKNFKFL